MKRTHINTAVTQKAYDNTREEMIPYEVAKAGNADKYLNKTEELEQVKEQLKQASLKQIDNYSSMTQTTGKKDNRSSYTSERFETLRGAMSVSYEHFYDQGSKWNEALYIQSLANEIVEQAGQLAELISKRDQILVDIKQLFIKENDK